MRRAALYLATSSSRLLWALKKKERCPANSSTSRPASTAACTYAEPLDSVKASSCAAVDPASRIWQPEMEMVFQRGRFSRQYLKISVTMRMEGLGGKI